MSAKITDYFNKAADGNGSYPTLAVVSATRTAGQTVLSCEDLTGWTTETPVHFSTYQLNSAGVVDTTTQTDWKGIVSGNTITSLTRIAGAKDTGNSIGDRVELNPTIGWLDDLITGLLKSHNQDGSIAVPQNAGAHNGIYRGKSLGTSVTDAQWAQIQNGTFDDLFIGDYWTIGGRVYRIAAFDYWLGYGVSLHHIVIVPDVALYKAQMNTTDTTEGAYIGSAMRTANLESAKNTINSAFGSTHVLSHGDIFSNAMTNGYESGIAWADSTVDLMSEIMVYGCRFFSGSVAQQASGIMPAYQCLENGQLPLFRLDRSKISNGDAWWFRDVANAACFAAIDGGGNTGYYGAANSYGVRPAFAIH